MSFGPELGVLLGDSPLTEEVNSRPNAIAIMLPFYFLSDFTQNVMQMPLIAIVADFAQEQQTSAQILRIIISSFFSRIFVMLAAIYNPTTSVMKMHIFFLVIDGLSIVFHLICYVSIKEVPLVAPSSDFLEPSNFLKKQIGFFRDLFKSVISLPKHLLGLGICFAFAGFATATNLRYMQLTGQLTFAGDPVGSSTCGDNCTEAQLLFVKGNITAAQILSVCGWVCFFLYFGLFLFLDKILNKLGMRILYAINLFALSTMAFIPLCSIWPSAVIQFFISIAQQLVWQLPQIDVAIYCYINSTNNISFLNSALNAWANIGQICSGVLNSTISSLTYFGFGLTYFIAGITSFFAGLLALVLLKENDHAITPNLNHQSFIS